MARSRSLSQARSVTEPPPRMTTRASKGFCRWAARASWMAVRIEDGASTPWKVAGKKVEVAESRTLEQIGFPAEVAQTRRGLGADDGDPDEFDRCRELLVPVVETGLLELLPDSGEFGGEITEGIGRVNVLDDQIETVEGVEPDPGQAEDLDVGFGAPRRWPARTWR